MIRVLALVLMLAGTAQALTYTTFQVRRDTSVNWTAANPVLAAGEIGCEMSGSPLRCTAQKVGDGVTAWASLPYYTQGGGSTPVFYNGGTVNLPSDGEVYYGKADNTAAPLVLVPAEGQTIDNEVSYSLTVQNETVHLRRVGSNWVKL